MGIELVLLGLFVYWLWDRNRDGLGSTIKVEFVIDDYDDKPSQQDFAVRGMNPLAVRKMKNRRYIVTYQVDKDLSSRDAVMNRLDDECSYTYYNIWQVFTDKPDLQLY